MRRFTFVVLILGLVLGGLWLWNHNSDVHDMISQYVENGEIVTLEARYSPEQIMEAHYDELIADDDHSFQSPAVKFHPYLLMEVKYTQPDQKTREGVILWSLVDGEMVLNTETWEKTHGFEDAIDADATRTDFKVLNALAKNKNSMTFDQLQRELHVESDVLQPWLNSVLNKQLVIQKGNQYQLHFQDPKILVSPQTKITQWLVTKPYNHAQQINKKYNGKHIRNIARAAFGEDFTIRNMNEVFLPVISIEVLNPDGSILTTYWNALNGQRIPMKYLAQLP